MQSTQLWIWETSIILLFRFRESVISSIEEIVIGEIIEKHNLDFFVFQKIVGKLSLVYQSEEYLRMIRLAFCEVMGYLLNTCQLLRECSAPGDRQSTVLWKGIAISYWQMSASPNSSVGQQSN